MKKWLLAFILLLVVGTGSLRGNNRDEAKYTQEAKNKRN